MRGQLHLPLAGTYRRGRIVLSKADRELLESVPANDVPVSLLMEMRAQRAGCSLSELRAMRSYDLSRELADEVALVALGDWDGQRAAYRPDEALLDAIAKRESAERLADFLEWRRQRSA